MRQVFIGWGVAVKRKAAGLFTIYFPHPLLHVRTSHNVEGLLFMRKKQTDMVYIELHWELSPLYWQVFGWDL